MYDEEVKGQVIIEKTDKSNGNKLSGAVFEIRDENDKVMQNQVSLILVCMVKRVHSWGLRHIRL